MDSPRISVIIPVHNSERYLCECLDSVLAQTERCIEVLCVDDGSSDSSPEILGKYARRDPRIQVIRQDCRGAGAARNAGLEVAQGAYLSFLDSDDFFEPDMLETTSRRMDETGADLAVFGAWVYDTNRQIDRNAAWTFRSANLPSISPFSWRDMPGKIFNTFGNYTWNKLFRTEFVRQNHILFQEISRTNDLLFVCEALVLAHRIVTLDRRLVHYRVASGTSLQATNDQDPLSFFTAFKALRDFLVDQDLFACVEISFLNHALDGVIANLESLKTIKGFDTLRSAITSEIEPCLSLLSKPDEVFFDQGQLRQYKDLFDSDSRTYLFRHAKQLQEDRDGLYWHLSQRNAEVRQLEQQVQQLRRVLDEATTKGQKAQSELDAVKSSTSFRLGVTLTAPARALKELLAKKC